jgi:hypothetical protein
MSEIEDKVAEAIREKLGTRHQGLPKGGWDGLMKMAAVAAIEVMRKHIMEDSYRCSECETNVVQSDDIEWHPRS